MSEAAGRRCPNGHDVRDGVAFCTKCGESLSPVAPEAQPSQEVASPTRTSRGRLVGWMAGAIAALLAAGALGAYFATQDDGTPTRGTSAGIPAPTVVASTTTTRPLRSTTTSVTSSTTSPPPADTSVADPGHPVLTPAVTPSVAPICDEPISQFAPGSGTPDYLCSDGVGIKREAWSWYAKYFPSLASLGENASIEDFKSAYCTVIGQEGGNWSGFAAAFGVMARYYGWENADSIPTQAIEEWNCT